MADPVFRSAYDFLAPSPDATYGTGPAGFFAQNRPGSGAWVQEGDNTRLSIPDWLRSAMQGVVGLGESTQTGSLTPEALALLTTGSVGTGALMAPRGALATGGAKLPSMAKTPPTYDEFKQMVSRGRMRLSDDDTVKPAASELAKAGSPLDFGRLYRYTEDDIAHFYNRSLGGLTEAAYKTYLRSLERAAFPPADKPIPYPTPGGPGGGKTQKIQGMAAPIPVGTPGFDVQPPAPPGFRVAKDMVF